MLSKITRLATTAIDTANCWSELYYLEFLARRGARSALPVTGDVLMIAWQFPPDVTGGVYRPLSFARYFAKVGQPMTVIAANPPGKPLAAGEHLARQLPASVRVLRIDTANPRRVPGHNYFPRVDGNMTAALDIASRALREYGDARPRVILVTGPPFHSAVAGCLLSKIWGVPLVMDYRDEWTENPMNFVQIGPADLEWEKRVNAQASRVVVVSEPQRVQHVQRFGLPDRSCRVVTNGWEPEDQDVADVALPAGIVPDGSIRIVFTGLLTAHTAPDQFLVTLHEMLASTPTVCGRTITLQFLGLQSPEATAVLAAHTDAYGDEVKIRSFGVLPKSEAVAVTQASDILFNVNPPHLARYIPGKMYEYMATGRPILIYGTGGEIERIINETQSGVVVPIDDPAALRRAIERLVQQQDWMGPARRDWLDRHRRDVQAAAMLDILNEVV